MIYLSLNDPFNLCKIINIYAVTIPNNFCKLMMLSPSDTPWNIPALFMRRFVTHYLNFVPQNVALLYSNCETWPQTNFKEALFKSFFLDRIRKVDARGPSGMDWARPWLWHIMHRCVRRICISNRYYLPRNYLESRSQILFTQYMYSVYRFMDSGKITVGPRERLNQCNQCNFAWVWYIMHLCVRRTCISASRY